MWGQKHGWSNRVVAGDSLLVINSLLEKEGPAGQVQMIYVDRPGVAAGAGGMVALRRAVARWRLRGMIGVGHRF